MPKKTLALILTLALLTALCACGRRGSANSGSSSSGMTGGSSSSMTGGSSSGATGGMGGGSTSGTTGGTNGGTTGGTTGGMDDSNSFSGGAGGSMSGSVSGSIGPDGISGSASGSTSVGGSGSGANSGSSSGSRSNSNSNSDSSSAAATAAAPGASDAWMTRLVNAASPLPEGFTVETVNIRGYDARPFDKRAAPDLEAMLADAEQAGCKLYLVSGYRSVERQTALFKRKTNAFLAEGFDQAEAERQAAMWVARPGTSEHNTGRAADIVSADWYSAHDDLTADFEATPECAWLMEHCAEYGFILRYPKGKEDVTGVTYEPWHYRYVGKEAAAQIMAAGGTLEEYHAGTL